MPSSNVVTLTNGDHYLQCRVLSPGFSVLNALTIDTRPHVSQVGLNIRYFLKRDGFWCHMLHTGCNNLYIVND